MYQAVEAPMAAPLDVANHHSNAPDNVAYQSQSR